MNSLRRVLDWFGPASCGDDCFERIICSQAGKAGHHFCGLSPCGCPKHHACDHDGRVWITLEQLHRRNDVTGR